MLRLATSDGIPQPPAGQIFCGAHSGLSGTHTPGTDHRGVTTWIIALDQWGRISIVQAPDIHQSFLEPANAEEIGVSNIPPMLGTGVYRIRCLFMESHPATDDQDYEYTFRCLRTEPIWLAPITAL